MQLYAVNFIPLLSSLYMFRAAHTPIIRSTMFSSGVQCQCLASLRESSRDDLCRYYGLYQWLQIQLNIVLLMMGVCAARNMQSEISRVIKFTACSCICWLFHRIEFSSLMTMLQHIRAHGEIHDQNQFISMLVRYFPFLCSVYL